MIRARYSSGRSHRKADLTLALAAALILTAGCGSGADSERPKAAGSSTPPSAASPTGIPGCAPACLSGLSNPGAMPAGKHTTEHFLAGQLTVTFPAPWESQEDQPVEFSAAPQNQAGTHRLLFWSDLLPVGSDGKRVTDMVGTAKSLLTWLAARPNLRVSAAKPTTIGASALPAQTVDIAISPTAKNEDPNCPDVCVAFLTWPNAGENLYGIGGYQVVRLTLADIRYGGQNHLLAVAVESRDADDLKTFTPLADRVIATANAPVMPG